MNTCEDCNYKDSLCANGYCILAKTKPTYELRCLVCDYIWQTNNPPIDEQCPKCKKETDLYIEEKN